MLFIVDFDGTISLKDTVDEALEAFGTDRDEIARIEDAWVQGHIGSRECLAEQFKHTQMTPTQFLEFARSIKIDPDFKDFYTAAIQEHKVFVVSDGLDALIGEVFKANNLENVSFFSNHVVWESQDRFDLAFPYTQATCTQASGVCKCAVAQAQNTSSQKVIMIGDGRSDFCVAEKADLVFAKKSLLKHCANNNIPHVAYEGFADINAYFGFTSTQQTKKPAKFVA